MSESEQSDEGCQLLVGHLDGLKQTLLLHFTSRDVARLDVPEHSQHEAFHLRAVVLPPQERRQLGDREAEYLDLLAKTLVKLSLVLFQGESPLVLLLSLAMTSSSTILLVCGHFITGLEFDRIRSTLLALLIVTSFRLVGRLTLGCIHGGWLLLELGHCEPFLRSLALHRLQDHVKFEAKVLLLSRWLFRVDRVASPLNDGLIADAVDLG